MRSRSGATDVDEMVTGTLHRAVAAAEAEIQRLEAECKAAGEAAAALVARRKELEAELREARISEAMGRRPERMVGELKVDLAALAEDLEVAEAWVMACERWKSEAGAPLADARRDLQQAERAWFEQRAAAARQRMEGAARALAQAQLPAIALARLVQNRPDLRDEAKRLIPTHLVWARILSDVGGLDATHFPAMGDRRVSDDQIAVEMAEIRRALEAL